MMMMITMNMMMMMRLVVVGKARPPNLEVDWSLELGKQTIN